MGVLDYNTFIKFVERGGRMCDVKKYSDIFTDLKTLQPEDTLQLELEANNEEERDFFRMLGDFILQQRQKKVIERNLF